MKYLLIIIAFLFLNSCDQVISEAQALEKNEQGVDAMNHANYDEAIVYFKEAAQSKNIRNNTRSTIYRNLAQVYIDKQMPDSAILYSTKAADCFEKGTYDYLVNMADVDLMTGMTQNALEKLKQAYPMMPNDVAVNNSIGLIYLGEYGAEFQDLEAALPYNLQAFNSAKDMPTEYVLAKNYYELEQYGLAEKYFSSLHNKYPLVLDHTVSLGLTKYQLNKKAEAELLFDEVIRQDSSFAVPIELFKQQLIDM